MTLSRPLSVLVGLLGLVAQAAHAGDGKYLDALVLRDTGNGRDFSLDNEYRYLDPQNTVWTVPKGAIVNGASIPRYLWSIVGGPWEGVYRNASVIHDYFFDRKQYDSDSVHRVFYDAMITSGVNRLKAKVMYFAVVRFNPAWKAVEVSLKPCPQSPPGHARYNCYPVRADEAGAKVVYQLVTPQFDEAEMARTASLIEKTDPPLEEITRLAKAKRGF